MRMSSGLLPIGIFLLIGLCSQAQSITSYKELALNFSRINVGGSARIQGLGGTQVSLGGDYSSAYSNPAGLGMFHRSEFTFSSAFNQSNINSSYLENAVKDSNAKVIVPGMSLVFYSPYEDRGGFLGGAFGISFNRVNNFNQSFTYEGVNPPNSLIDAFIQDATGSGPWEQFGYTNPNASNFNSSTELAYHNYLIDTRGNLNSSKDSTHYSSVVITNPILQHEQVFSQGSQSQVNLSYGANFEDHLFVGLGIGLSSLNYTNKKTYSENFNDNFFSNFRLIEDLSIKGSGINATLGAIYKPIDIIQFGISIATPTSYSLTDSYQLHMNTLWKNFPYTNATQNDAPQTDIITSDYNLTTPWKFNGGGTFFFKKYGFISADVELLNYGSSNYTSFTTGVFFSYDNEQIKKLYTTTINYRIGGEFRLNKFRFRGGFNLMPDPYKTAQNGVDNSYQSISIGFGYKTPKFYIDATSVLSQGSFSYRPYVVSSNQTPLVTAKQNNTLVMVTVGFPF
jgi:hypothetical protein